MFQTARGLILLALGNLKDKIEAILFPAFEKYLSQIMKLANEKQIPSEFVPTKGREGWCRRCKISHEAEFFFLALLYHAAHSFVWSIDDWKFADKEMRCKVVELYAHNRLADPKELSE